MRKDYTALTFVLKALIPYSKESITLGFEPNKFFNQLEQTSGHKRKTLQTAYYRARDKELIDENYHLTKAGWDKVIPYTAKTLNKDVVLMVIFDIPESLASSRRNFRKFLKSLGFTQEQQSVWVSRYDFVEYVNQYINELDLSNFVQVYEAARVK